MRLAALQLTNFRACRSTSVELAADLTVVVGENASGKSAIIDALRLATYPASGRTTAWFSSERDLNHHAAEGTPVSIMARYSELTEPEKAIYLAQLVDNHDDLTYTASFATAPDTPRRSILSWSVGETFCEDPEPNLRRRIAHVYLPPLRDAVRDIDSGDQAQLHEVLQILIGSDPEKKTSFIDNANTAFDTVASHPLAEDVRHSIETFFTQTTPPNRRHRLELNRREVELRRITRLLRLQLAERDIAIGDIASTGLGYANLLYISMIVLQLTRRHDSDLTILLVEEPEAHLHPQLQLVLLDFLRQTVVRVENLDKIIVTEALIDREDAYHRRDTAMGALSDVRLLHHKDPGNKEMCVCKKIYEKCDIALLVDQWPGVLSWERSQAGKFYRSERHRLKFGHPALTDRGYFDDVYGGQHGA